MTLGLFFGFELIVLFLSLFFSIYKTSVRLIYTSNLFFVENVNQTKSESNKDVLLEKNKVFLTIGLGEYLSKALLFSSILYFYFHYYKIVNIFTITSLIFIISILFFVFLEFIPKIYSINQFDKLKFQKFREIKANSYLLKLFIIAFSPITIIINKAFSEKLINLMIENLWLRGKVTSDLKNIETTLVSSVFTPRVDMIYVSVESSAIEILKTMIKEKYSRVPVYEENIDNIIGVLHIKDLIQFIGYDLKNAEKTTESILSKPYHVPENKLLKDLLNEMQLKRLQMVIVNDEYGGTTGLITMEDILEEIVGEIRDEHDYDEFPLIHKINSNILLVDAKVSVDEVNKELNLNLPNNQSIGGLVFNTIGEVPTLKQTVSIENINFRVEEIDGIRIQKVLITKKKKIKSSKRDNLIQKVTRGLTSF